MQKEKYFICGLIECNRLMMATLCKNLVQKLKVHTFWRSVTNDAIAVTQL